MLTVQNLTSSVTWNSSETAVATISNTAGSNGLANVNGVGTTTIRATSGSISGSTTLTVTPVVLESILVTPVPQRSPARIQQFIATGHFTDGSTQDLTTLVAWNSSDTSVAYFDNIAGRMGIAVVTFNGGTTLITATLSGLTSN